MNRSGRGEHLETGGHKAENNSKTGFSHVVTIATDDARHDRRPTRTPGATATVPPWPLDMKASLHRE